MANVNLANADGATPLIAASFRGHAHVTGWQTLVQIGLADADGATPLVVASQEGHLDVVTALAGRGADVDMASAGRGDAHLQSKPPRVSSGGLCIGWSRCQRQSGCRRRR